MFVIPVINESNFEEIKKKIQLVEPYCDWVQLDIADGIFTSHQTWNQPADLLSLESDINVEVHLMIAAPENFLENWLAIPLIKRAIVHFESTQKIDEIIQMGERYQKEIGLAINPETDWQVLKPYLGKIKFVQILAVKPGAPGQKFNLAVIDKIKSLKQFQNEVIIEVDGGVTPENARLLKEAGADILNSATYLFGSQNLKKAIEKLELV